MPTDEKDYDKYFLNSAVYEEYLAERDEIKRHKWIESEKAGRDIGWEKSLLDWKFHHSAAWRKHRRLMREVK
jgi:hypothetical protein